MKNKLNGLSRANYHKIRTLGNDLCLKPESLTANIFKYLTLVRLFLCENSPDNNREAV